MKTQNRAGHNIHYANWAVLTLLCALAAYHCVSFFNSCPFCLDHALH